MALDTDLVCTVSLTSGSKDFAVAGINLTTADIEPGDEIKLPAKGLTLTIGDVTTAATGKLTDNCPAAAAGAAQPARIRYQADLSRAAVKFEALITLLKSGNVDALAGLALANNKGIHATGLNTLATHDQTAFARQLAGDASASAVLSRLGVNTGQSNAPVRLRLPGNALEFGHNNPSGYGSMLGCDQGNGNPWLLFNGMAGATNNTYKTLGIRKMMGIRNSHLTGLEVITVADDNADNQASTTVASIRYNGDIYQGSRKVVDAGSNANGDYVRYASGWQECFGKIAWPLQAQGAGQTVTWSFPAAFLDTNYRVWPFPHRATGSGGQTSPGRIMQNGIYTNNISVAQVQIQSYSYEKALVDTMDIYVHAAGKWAA